MMIKSAGDLTHKEDELLQCLIRTGYQLDYDLRTTEGREKLYKRLQTTAKILNNLIEDLKG